MHYILYYIFWAGEYEYQARALAKTSQSQNCVRSLCALFFFKLNSENWIGRRSFEAICMLNFVLKRRRCAFA